MKMKVINDLIGYKNMKVVQNPDWFSFSLDSVLLPRFVTLNKEVKNILDIGTGNAPIPLILSTRTNANIYGVEIQNDIYNLAVETININKLESQIKIINDDIKNIGQHFKSGFFDVIVSNPPYFKLNEKTRKNDDIHKTIARHELKLNLEDILKLAGVYLKNDGVLAIVHRSDRLIEIIELFRKYKIEPKRIQLIYPKENAEANIVLIEGRKGGKPGLKVLHPIIAHNTDGSYSKEITNYFS
ncbi:MAG: tRNA1(Val) (adenine(37)-N6)-methyltransferase [Bacilli bacterium]|nr:tRNA1(Val) (adenine(37)-N6)-methyltransferase [Bacilli bacterium]